MNKNASLSNPDDQVKVVYAGDRDIAVWVLKFLLDQGVKPVALLLAEEGKASHANQLAAMCSYLDSSCILKGSQFRTEQGITRLRELAADYILSIHFPYVYPREVLGIPMRGVLNLHPAYLPYNRGWHTASWAILDGTPYGATLHFVDEGLDTGDIVHQRQLEMLPDDTADTLYKRAKRLEFKVFKEAWPSLLMGNYVRKRQPVDAGSIHRKADLQSMQELDLNVEMKAGDLIRRMRALTTNNPREATCFEAAGKQYYAQLRFVRKKRRT